MRVDDSFGGFLMLLLMLLSGSAETDSEAFLPNLLPERLQTPKTFNDVVVQMIAFFLVHSDAGRSVGVAVVGGVVIASGVIANESFG